MSGKMETHIGTQDTPVGSSASAEEERTSNLRRHGLTKRRLEEEEDLDQLQNRVYDASLLELRQAFATCDRDGTGYISQEELGDSLRSIGIKMDGDELEYLYKRLDKNGDGKVGFEEFLRVLADECEEAELEAELHEMQSFFAMADKDGSGRLSVAELQRALQPMGMQIDIEDCQYLFNRMATDKHPDGLSFDEFALFLLKYDS